jgi:sigma-B regulation protein RsbU (phosphoserine phosphatase)
MGLLQISNHAIKYSIAGLPPILHYNFDNDIITECRTENIPLGIKKDFSFSELNLEMKQGDALLAYTDGLNELFNERRELLGFDKIKKTFKANAFKNSSEIINEFKTLISEWKNNSDQNDDISIVIIKKL